ncbi:hypothetical protein C7999DRAFT_14214 [Corynascus novoguineensis]|uniref:Uncharacterized protein n=1 Tax=Corynascus novoguineensis TaxID=1126955 RepID=A0AAN7HQR2_9PEZI|nr:hypothetical protein C7999DRAFT_14214 [Corynascus novoguineensis]
MSGRGRARPPSRSAQEPAAGASRRSTRQQQQQQNTAPAGEEQPPSSAEEDHQEQQKSPEQQEQLEQAHNPSLQPEAPMSAPMYHQDIDPAITGSQDAGMPPPPVPGSKGPRGHTELGVPRRGTRRGASSVVSINSHPVTDAFSSQPEPQNTGLLRATSARLFETPGPAPSVVSSAIDDTPSRRAAREQLMGVMLSRLFFAADDYFNHTRSEQTDPEMWDAEQEAFKDAFDTYRRHYVADDTAPFVDFNFVADTMRLDKKPALWHKVFKVVSAANFAILFDEITLVKQQDLLPRLQAWHSAFPGLFIAEGSDTTAYARSEQVIEQALLIRMQLSIATLEVLKRDSRVPFNPVEEIAKIWCDGDVSLESIEAFLGNNDDAIQLKPVAPTSFEAAALDRDRNANRFRSICVLLPKHSIEGHDLDLSQLQDTYPLKEFLETLRSFVAVCFGNIKASLQHDLTHSDAASRAESQIRFQLETDAMAPGFDRSESSTQMEVFDSTGLRMLKQQLQGSPAFGDSQQLSQSSYPPAPRIPYPPGFSSPSPALGYADSMQQGGLQSNGSMYAESAAQVSGRKRGAQDDPSMAAESTAPPAKKTRTRRKKKDVPQAAMDPASTAISASAALAPPASQSQYPPLPGTQDEPDFDALSQRTREITAAARKVKEPQVRSSWVSRDVKLLVKAVNTYQCKWSTIEKEIKAGTIPFERPRDQQALRDKARLLKQDFLKADMVLPRGFDLVVLGKKEREAVKAVGRNPDRKEADIDENGQPINTQYAGEGAAPAVLPAPLHSVNPQPEQQLQQLQSQPEQQPQHQPEHQSGHQPEHQPEQAEPQPAAPEQVVA